MNSFNADNKTALGSLLFVDNKFLSIDHILAKVCNCPLLHSEHIYIQHGSNNTLLHYLIHQ